MTIHLKYLYSLSRLAITIYQDKRPVDGKYFPRGNFYTMNLVEKLNPKTEDGDLDCRYTELSRQIINGISQQTLAELSELRHQTNQIQEQYSRSGLRFVVGFFQVEMENWQRKAFKKQIRSLLQECGFKPSMTTKLLAAGEFVAGELPGRPYNSDLDFISEEEHKKEHQSYLQYLRGYGVVSLYLLSQMDHNGRRLASEHFQKTNSRYTTRELENLKQQYPRWSSDYWTGRQLNASSEKCSLIQRVRELEAVEDADDLSDNEMVEQFVSLARSINWPVVCTDITSRELLLSIKQTIGNLAEMVNEVSGSVLA